MHIQMRYLAYYLVLLLVVLPNFVCAGASGSKRAVADSDFVIFHRIAGTNSVLSARHGAKLDSSVFFNAKGIVYDVKYHHISGQVGILSKLPGVLVDSVNSIYSELPRMILQVVDSIGSLITEADIQVGKYSFSPDGSRIVCITGPYLPEGDIKYSPQQLGLIDVRNGSLRWLISNLKLNNSELVFQVHWAATNEIYVNSGKRLYRVDQVSGELFPLELNGSSDISPNGGYQLVNGKLPIYGDSIRVFHMADGNEISASLYGLIGDVLSRRAYIISVGWYGSVGAVLYVDLTPMRRRDGTIASKIDDHEAYLIDVSTGSLLLRDEEDELDFKSFHRVVASSPYVVRQGGVYKLLNENIIEKIQQAVNEQNTLQQQ